MSLSDAIQHAQDTLAKADQEEWLTVKEYAALVRRHPQTVYRAIYRGAMQDRIIRPTGGGYLIRVPKTQTA